MIITLTHVLAIHDRMIEEFGGSHGIRDLSLLESAVARPYSSFDGQDLYQTIFNKAAALLQSLLKNHPFLDGNKRTALASAGMFLEMSGYIFTNTHQQEVDFAISVDQDNLSIEQISVWLKANCKKGR